MVGSLSRKTLRQEAYDMLLEAILDGKYVSGSRLDEKELANKLGISRTPVREALNRLVQEGIIIEIPYRGIYVRTFSQSEIFDIYEVRKSLEVLAIKLAVRNMTDSETVEIEELVNKIDKAQNNNDISEYSYLDSKFHERIAIISGNKTLIKMLTLIDLQVKMIRQMVNQDVKVVRRSQFERVKILDAIRNKDEKSAAAFMEEHIDNVSNDAVNIVMNKDVKK